MVSLVFVLTNLYIFIRRNKMLELFTLYILFSIFIQVGYAIKIGDFVIVMNDIMLLYLFILTCLKILKEKKINKLNGYIILFCLFIFFGYLNIYSNSNIQLLPISGDFDRQFIYGDQLRKINFSKDNILRIIIFFMFLIVLINNNIIKYKSELEKRILIIGFFQIGYIIFEYFSKISGMYPIVIDKILLVLGSHGDYQVRRIIVRDGSLWLQGLTLESGYLGFTFFIILLTLNNLIGKKYRILEIIVIFLSILNRSLTSFILVCFYLIYKLLKQKINIKKFLILTSILLVVLILVMNYDFSKYINRIENIINGDKSIRSENIRRDNIVNSIKLILQHPFLGYGLGNTRALSGILSFILNIGILGTFLWFNLINKILHNKSIVNKILVVAIFFVLGGIENLYNIYIPLIILLLEKNQEARFIIEKKSNYYK